MLTSISDQVDHIVRLSKEVFPTIFAKLSHGTKHAEASICRAPEQKERHSFECGRESSCTVS